MKTALAVSLLLASPAHAAHQDWKITHQPDRFNDRVMMEAWADNEKGPGRMALYCDTESGFRVMFLPNADWMPEGASRITMTIDDGKPLVLDGDAFGDNKTDVVTIHDSSKLQRSLSGARKIAAHFLGLDGRVHDAAYTFGELATDRATLMKVCPVK